ncbi:MAG: RsmE family RNA methyltransferase [bacterium]|nr:RsmE family RNA methyltransferase [bacterium]
MRLHRFYTKEKIAGKKEISVFDERLIHQWRKVLRFKNSQKIMLFNGDGKDFLCEIILLERRSAHILVLESSPSLAGVPKFEVHLFQSLLKNNNFEFVLEKCAELGVSHFHPMLSERSEKKDFNRERLEKILVGSSEQSGQGFVPKIFSAKDFYDKENFSQEIPKILFSPLGKPFHGILSKLKARFHNGKPIYIFIGPEGGFSQTEINFASEKGVEISSLGAQTLRAETASVAAVAILLL